VTAYTTAKLANLLVTEVEDAQGEMDWRVDAAAEMPRRRHESQLKVLPSPRLSNFAPGSFSSRRT